MSYYTPNRNEQSPTAGDTKAVVYCISSIVQKDMQQQDILSMQSLDDRRPKPNQRVKRISSNPSVHVYIPIMHTPYRM